jgi:hypothetical protein
MSVLLSLQRAIMVERRTTEHITVASALEVLTVATSFTVLGFGLDLVGATAAFAAFFAGRSMSNTYLAYACRGIFAESEAARGEA